MQQPKVLPFRFFVFLLDQLQLTTVVSLLEFSAVNCKWKLIKFNNFMAVEQQQQQKNRFFYEKMKTKLNLQTASN
jgi:hypothetical protein